jgi:membrane-anchored mycosin MYCP
VVSPAWYDDYVLTVGSVNADGMPSAFTLAGPWVDVAATGEAVTALGSEPVSGTSYAAPLVSGLAALIRARFPTLTARQVMQRIESTAHHPPSGWDPLVGNGTIDALVAVSTDAGPPATTSKPAPAPLPVATPPPPKPPDSHARDTALHGAAICLLALAGVLATGRLWGSRHRVPGD